MFHTDTGLPRFLWIGWEAACRRQRLLRYASLGVACRHWLRNVERGISKGFQCEVKVNFREQQEVTLETVHLGKILKGFYVDGWEA